MKPIPEPALDGDTRPIRGELLSVSALEAHARDLAARFTLAPETRRGVRRFYERLNDNARVLVGAYRTLASDVGRSEPVTPAAEWLLDNFHLIESEIVSVRHDLPSAYYRELPKLAPREKAGTARIDAMALELIAHSDGRLDLHRLTRFVTSYQTLAPLTIGELWAWPIMLRIGLVENLRRFAEEILERRAARLSSDRDFARFESARAGRRATELPETLHTAYVVQLLQHLREHGPRASHLRARLEARLDALGRSTEDVIHAEHQAQATLQVSMANTITSLRLCGSLDWSEFFERVSLVEHVLQRDPAGVYAKMDFRSRDRYRQIIEELAEPSAEAQMKVALRAVESAQRSSATASSRTSSPGTCPRARGTRVAAAGRGTPAPPDCSSASAWKESSACRGGARRSPWRRASRPRGPRARSLGDSGAPCTRSRSRTARRAPARSGARRSTVSQSTRPRSRSSTTARRTVCGSRSTPSPEKRRREWRRPASRAAAPRRPTRADPRRRGLDESGNTKTATPVSSLTGGSRSRRSR